MKPEGDLGREAQELIAIGFNRSDAILLGAMLARGEKVSPRDLMAATGMSRPWVSNTTKRLSEQGLIRVYRQGRFRLYKLIFTEEQLRSKVEARAKKLIEAI